MKIFYMLVWIVLLTMIMQIGVCADSSTADDKSAGNTTITNIVIADTKSEESEGLLLKVKLDESAFRASGKLALDLLCKNLLDCPLGISMCIPALEYHIDLIDPNGKKLMEQRFFSFVSDGGIQTLKSGEERKSRWNLNSLFSIQTPGIYKLSAYRDVPRLDGQGKAKLVSNQISFELTKDDIAANARYWTSMLEKNSSLRFKKKMYDILENEESKTGNQ